MSDSQTDGHRPSNRSVAVKLRARVMARGGQFENLTLSSVLIPHCIAGPYIFMLYIMFHSNVGDDNDDA